MITAFELFQSASTKAEFRTNLIEEIELKDLVVGTLGVQKNKLCLDKA